MFFGKKKDKTASPETSKNILGSTSIGSSATGSPIQQATQIFSSIHKIFLDAIEDEKLHNERMANHKEEDKSEDDRKHEALIKAITARRKAKPKKEKAKPKTKKNVTKEEKPKVETPKVETPKVTAPTTPAKTTTPAPKVETRKVIKEVVPATPAKTTTPAPKVETSKVEAPKPTTPAPKETTPPSVKPVESKPNAPISEKVSGVAKAIKPGASLLSVTKLADSGVDISSDKINPELQNRIASMATDFKEKTGKSLMITSGYRSNEKQKQLWDAKMAQTGDPAATKKLVAEPMPPLGSGAGSPHMRGMAIDINSKGAEGLNTLAGPRTASTGWLESFGLVRPVANEDWHIQMSGTTPVGDGKLVPNKTGSAVEVSSGQTKISGSEIDNISKENAKLKESTKEIKKKTTNNNTEINETTTDYVGSGSSDKNAYLKKTQGVDKNTSGASPYLIKAQS
jgi:LAS superfamily LD-carboxypeptidase LdcB